MLNKKLLGSVSSPPSDDNFENVSLLLNGDGTNGAQNNTFLDSSTNNFTITRNGNTTQGSFSPYGSLWSNFFNGSSNLVTSSSQVIPSGSYTLEAMVFVTSSSATQTIFAQGTGTGDSARTFLGIEDNSGAKWAIQIGGTQAISSVTPVLNTWHYVAMTFNGSTMTLYLNGTSIASASASTNASNTTLQLGKNWGTYWFNGYISNARVSNTVRTIGAAPTAPFSVDANTVFLSCQANRFRDASTNNYALSVQNGSPSVQRFSPFNPTSSYSTSVIGGSGYFDGSGDYLTLANDAAYQFGSGDFTIDGWFYSTSSGDQVVISRWSSPDSNSAFEIIYFSSVLYFQVASSAAAISITTSSFPLNQWNFFAMSKSGTTMAAWLNGTRIGTATVVTVNNGDQGPSIGVRSGGTSFPFAGYLANLRVVKGTDVYGVSNTTITVPTAPTTAITNTSLLLGFTNAGIPDLAMQNNLETVGNAQVSTSVKKYGTGSLAFDGSGDFLSYPSSVFGGGDFTVEGWVYFNSTSGDQTIFGINWNSNANSLSAVRVDISSGVFRFMGSTDGTNFYFFQATSTSPSTSTWYHIALVRNSGTVTFYVDGTSVNSTSSVPNALYAGTGGSRIGNILASSNNYLNGYVDDFRITNGVARYTANFTAPTKALETF